MAIISLGKIRRVIIFPLLMMCNSIFNSVMMKLCAKVFHNAYKQLNSNDETNTIQDLNINKFGIIQNFHYRMLPRRIIALVFIVLLDVFFWYYTIVFCGIYVNAQYGWFYSGIWSLMWVWVVYAPIYILIISLFEHCGNQCCVYYMKRFFIF